jgi:DNA-binding GntR family transcriptional regulator
MTNPESAKSVLGELPASERARSAYEVAFNRLRNAIITGRIAGGTHLVQATLARELGVSTTPVREVLRQLSSEGLVEFDPRRGAVVRSVEFTELLEIYEIRALLEPRCMEIAAEHATDEALAYAADLQRQMEAEEDIGAWATLNREFHRALCECAPAPRMVAILQSLHAADALYVGVGLRMMPHSLEAGNQEHRKLLEALARRDPVAAASASRTHLEAAIELTKLAEQPAATEPGDPDGDPSG